VLLKDKECSGQLKKFENAEVQALLDENSTRTLEELAEALNIGKSTVSNRLHAMKKEGSKWIPHELFELVIQTFSFNLCTLLLSHHKKKQFLYQIVAMKNGSTMIILNIKNCELVQPLTTIPKRIIRGNKFCCAFGGI